MSIRLAEPRKHTVPAQEVMLTRMIRQSLLHTFQAARVSLCINECLLHALVEGTGLPKSTSQHVWTSLRCVHAR